MLTTVICHEGRKEDFRTKERDNITKWNTNYSSQKKGGGRYKDLVVRSQKDLQVMFTHRVDKGDQLRER